MGRDTRKPLFGGLRTTQAQTSLLMPAVWSVPLLFAFWKVSYVNLLQVKFNFLASLCSWGDWFETQKTSFIASKPRLSHWWEMLSTYSKCSKIFNPFLFLLVIKMLVIRTGSHKIFVWIANREDPDETGLYFLSMPYLQATIAGL